MHSPHKMRRSSAGRGWCRNRRLADGHKFNPASAEFLITKIASDPDREELFQVSDRLGDVINLVLKVVDVIVSLQQWAISVNCPPDVNQTRSEERRVGKECR